MALSAAEKQRRCRERRDADALRRTAYLSKEKQRWQRKKDTGVVKPVSQMSDIEVRKARRHWKVARAKNRKENKQRIAALKMIDTPPRSPVLVIDAQLPQQPSCSSQRSSGLRKRRHNKEKTLKKIDKLTEQLACQARETAKYKKRWERLKRKADPVTPRTHAMRLLRNSSTSSVRKTLIFHKVLVDQIRRKYSTTKGQRLRQTYSRLFTGAMVKKYRLQSYMQKQLGFSAKRWPKVQMQQRSPGVIFSRQNSACLAVRYKKKVQDFYARDDNSRMTTGKKETITKMKDKRQKRLLNDSVKNIHIKFLAEFTTSAISYSLFCRLKPFWIVKPTERDRQTCLCKLHENTQLVLTKLKALNILVDDNIDTIVQSVSCNTDYNICMYGDCPTCEVPQLPVNSTVDNNAETTWLQWKTIKEDRIIKELPKTVTITVKKIITGSVGDLIDECTSQLTHFKRHYMNIKHQYMFYRKLRQTLSENECLVHIDFAENYVCKLESEIQSMHFGASKKQVSLHTGVYYVGPEGHAKPFCSLSANLQHNPAAIWAHLNPVLDHLQQEHHGVDTINFYSDGPCTQYRQKLNFFLFTKELAQRGIKFGTWNFHEAGHGKGAPDGVGATVKRMADTLVHRGKDCPDAENMFRILQKAYCSIQLHLFSDEEIEAMINKVSQLVLPSVPRTMKIHQILTTSLATISYRDLSCLCRKGEICECFAPNAFTFPVSNASHESKTLSQPHDHISLLNKYVVVRYDAKPYPGLVVDEDHEDIQVKCMHCIGRNRFYWPTRDDICWYSKDDLICEIPEPEHVTHRHYQVSVPIWQKIESIESV